MLIPYNYNQPKTEITTSICKMGAPSVKLPLISWLFMIPYFWLILVMFTLSAVV